MAITRERFEQGLTYAEYKAQMTRNREQLEEAERAFTLADDDWRAFADLPRPLHVLALAEDWCGDVIANLPVLGRLAAASGRLDLRVFPRDQNLDLMDQYLNKGQFRSIPVFVFFDQDFNELGVWIERPQSFARQLEELRRTFFAGEPELQGLPPDTSLAALPEGPKQRLMDAMGALREEQRAASNAEVVRELRELLKLGASPSGGFVPGARPVRAEGGRRVGVSITYCAECGYEPQTLELAAKLLYTLGHALTSLELIPWAEGSFEVVVDGELVHSMYREGGFPEPDAIVAEIRRRLVAGPRSEGAASTTAQL